MLMMMVALIVTVRVMRVITGAGGEINAIEGGALASGERDEQIGRLQRRFKAVVSCQINKGGKKVALE